MQDKLRKKNTFIAKLHKKLKTTSDILNKKNKTISDKFGIIINKTRKKEITYEKF